MINWRSIDPTYRDVGALLFARNLLQGILFEGNNEGLGLSVLAKEKLYV
jgi:hypothetical protein